MQRLSLRYRLIYAMGNLGIALNTVMQTLFLVCFFFPPRLLSSSNSHYVGRVAPALHASSFTG